MTKFTKGRFDIINGRLFFNKKEVIHFFDEITTCTLLSSNQHTRLSFEYAHGVIDDFILDFTDYIGAAPKVYDFFKAYLNANWWEKKRRRWAYSLAGAEEFGD